MSEIMQHHISTIAAEYNTPYFPPHITLLTSPVPQRAKQDAIAALERGGWQLHVNKTIRVNAMPIAVLGDADARDVVRLRAKSKGGSRGGEDETGLKWSQVVILPVPSIYHIRPNAHISLIYDDELSVSKRQTQERRIR
ncbi:hypothetical protein EON63_19465, partial [archaeon]